MKRLIIILSLALLMGLVSSCAPSTPEKRIEQRPLDFAKLSEKHQEMVKKGDIEKGMSKDAVFFAWGRPAGRVEGLWNGKPGERWDYQGSYPVMHNHFFGGYSSGYYGGGRYAGYHGGFGPEVVYVPYVKASVWFVGDLVNEWERQR